jgi:hypothetical protein
LHAEGKVAGQDSQSLAAAPTWLIRHGTPGLRVGFCTDSPPNDPAGTHVLRMKYHLAA